jgi:hypothetical protein
MRTIRLRPPIPPAALKPSRLAPRLAFGLAVLASLALGQPAMADVVTNIGTGFNNATNSLYPPFALDPKYTIVGPGGVSYAPEVRYASALPSTYFGDRAIPDSRWLYLHNPGLPPTDPNYNNVPSGNYTYTTTVDLTGFDPASAFLGKLQVGADNELLSVKINGTAVFSQGIYFFPEEFHTPRDLAEVGLGLFHAGLNNIEFTVFNGLFDGDTGTSPSALRASGVVIANSAQAVGVPEPGTLTLVGVGLLGLLGLCPSGKRTAGK